MAMRGNFQVELMRGKRKTYWKCKTRSDNEGNFKPQPRGEISFISPSLIPDQKFPGWLMRGKRITHLKCKTRPGNEGELRTLTPRGNFLYFTFIDTRSKVLCVDSALSQIFRNSTEFFEIAVLVSTGESPHFRVFTVVYDQYCAYTNFEFRKSCCWVIINKEPKRL